jgi:two-component system LytT family response regulator
MKVLIVDDEPRARSRLARLLKPMKGIDVCGLASNGAEALEIIEHAMPDLVLLDVQMPGLDGFEVVDELKGSSLPLIIFVTAYDQYALKAFEVSAIDYLLKPVTEDRLRRALARAEELLQSNSAALAEAAEQYRRITEALATVRPAYRQRIVGHHAHRICIVPVSEIQAFQAEDELVFAILGNGKVLINRTLRELEAQLDPEQFARAHRQTILSLSHIAEIEPAASGGAVARLRSGLSVKISRRHAVSLRERLGW